MAQELSPLSDAAFLRQRGAMFDNVVIGTRTHPLSDAAFLRQRGGRDYSKAIMKYLETNNLDNMSNILLSLKISLKNCDKTGVDLSLKKAGLNFKKIIESIESTEKFEDEVESLKKIYDDLKEEGGSK